MPVNHIEGDAGVNTVKTQKMQRLKLQKKEGEESNAKQIRTDKVEISNIAREMGKMEKYKKQIENLPSANEGRIEELKAAIKDGTLVSNKVLDATAAAITNTLLK